MESFILIPESNPVNFYEQDLQPTGNLRLNDKYNYKGTVKDFEPFLRYTEKWVVGDLIRLQIWLKDVEYCNIDVIDCNGTILKTYSINIVIPMFLINDTFYNIGQFDINTNDLTPGEFHLRLNYQKAFTPTVYYRISEPQELLTELPNSVLFNYKHTFNEYGVIYKTPYGSYFEQDFNFRVEGHITDEKPESVRKVYEDQRLNLTLLSAKPFETYLFKIGFLYGVPSWVGKKLNYIASHNSIFCDEYQWTFAGEKFEKKSSNLYTRFGYECVARKTTVEYSNKILVPSLPSGRTPFVLPDAFEGFGYSFTIYINGTQPFSLGAVTKPTWMDLVLLNDKLTLTGTPGVGDVGTNIAVSISIGNIVGVTTFTDIIDVIALAACIPVSFAATPSLPDAVNNQAYNAFIALTGTAPYILSNVVKPAWATVASLPTGIEITGTPTAAATGVQFSFDISNCGGGPSNTIVFAQTINITSGVVINGNTSFSQGLNTGSGQIFAPPGYLVTVLINANGATFGFTLNTNITTSGVVVTGSTNVTDGSASYTFIMPIIGVVNWIASFIVPLVGGSAGGGSISVS